MPKLGDQAETRLAMAALFVALVEALQKQGQVVPQDVEAAAN